MKIQLFFPRDFKPYLEFNPTLGFIQGNGKFEIWAKLKPDRSILQTCSRFLVKQNEEPPKDEYEEFTMRIPVKVTGANQVLPVKFSLLCVFTVNAVTFTPPLVDFGNVFNQQAASCVITLENHSLLPQQYSFVRMPKEISVNTDNGTGTILPGEKYPLKIEYRPSQASVYEDSNLFVRLITGKITAREIKLPYTCSVVKCPIRTDKQKIEFPCLPETEFSEVVVQVTNESSKNYVVEIVPPNNQVCGLMVNPLVTDLKAGRSSLICIRYNSAFRDLTLKRMEELFKPKEVETRPGIGVRNKKLEERLKKERDDAAKDAPADPKAKPGAKAAPPAPAKKEEVKKPDPKAPKKTPQQEEEERLEAERIKKEAEDAELAKQQALEDAFDKHSELKSMGGKVYDFDVEDPNKRTQHYEWLLPIYYKNAEDPGMDNKKLKCIFLEARTTTVPRSLVANVETLDFGEVPVALRVTKEILLKNIGCLEEELKLQSLTPFGGFCVLNALRTISPGETKSVVI